MTSLIIQLLNSINNSSITFIKYSLLIICYLIKVTYFGYNVEHKYQIFLRYNLYVCFTYSLKSIALDYMQTHNIYI